MSSSSNEHSRRALSRLTPEQFRAMRRAPEAIPVVPRDGDTLPPSFAQQRLWFLSQLSAANSAYQIARAVEIEGELDEAALAWALDRLVARHESLRTVFESVDGAPRQRILPPSAGLRLERRDLRDAPDPDAAVAEAQRGERETPFDLRHAQPIRACLLRLGAARHVLLLTMHHIASDGWSMEVLGRELDALYSARRDGGDDPLPPLPVQYADYALWQRERLQGERLRQELDYWTTALTGAPPLLTLPTDRRRPSEQCFDGALEPVAFDPALSARVRAFALVHQATPFMVMLAAWAVVLARLSGQDDVVIGIPAANRDRREIEGAIGFFANTLAVRLRTGDADIGLRVRALLAQVREVALQAQSHQALPFDQVVERLNPERSLAHTPIFQVLFAWHRQEAARFPLGGLRTRVLDTPHATAKFDLTLNLGETGGSDGAPETFAGSIEYATALFDAGTVRRHVRHLRCVLEAMLDDAEAEVAALPLLDAPLRRQVLETFNATDADYPAPTSLHALFEASVTRDPQALAAVCEQGVLTYAELDARANRVAHGLLALGVRPDERVALCAERGLEMVVGLLGILKSGAAYVPLDPVHPQERLAEMLDDASPRAVLAHGPLCARMDALLRGADAPPLLRLDDAGLWEPHPAHAPSAAQTGLGPQHLAYVIYTSGSTGRPKGVMNQHDGVLNRLHWGQSRFAFGPGDRVLQKTPFGFDVSVWEFFQTWQGGATLVLAKPGGHQDPHYLSRLMVRERITVAHFVPSMLQAFLDAADPRDLATLRLVKCSGEALPAGVVRRFLQLLPQVELHNLYGPTEAAVETTHWPCRMPEGEVVPIGRPTGNVRTYILDARMAPVPPGVAGELYLGGVQVARGYLGRPELTAERFLDSPFRAGERLYRTGDLCRWREDGDIDYLGRNDFQVKIRGFRIELGEIEARLNAAAGVRESAVLARADGADGAQRLVGYVLASAEDFDAATLRATLAAVLPDYMIPSVFVRMDAWPLTASGKLDRRALPAPEFEEADARADYVAPSSELECRLAAIWAEVLGVERVGMHDHFFALGGHSLLAMRVIARLRRELDLELGPQMLFAAPVFAEFAEFVDILLAGREEAAALPTVDDGAVDVNDAPPGAVEERPPAPAAEAVETADAAPAVVDAAPDAADGYRDDSAQRARLEQLRAAMRDARRRPRGIVPQPRDGAPMPLSSAQRRLWFLSRVPGAEAAYHIGLTLDLRGALDLPALRAALDASLDRHESLRTRFVADAGQPMQVFSPPGTPFVLREVDLRGRADGEVVERALALEEVSAPFDLERGPPVRGLLIHRDDEAGEEAPGEGVPGEGRHRLVLTMHHIVSDGWSLEVYAREVSALYAACHRGVAPALAPLPIQYADYAVWQNAQLQGEALARERAHWRDALRGAPELLELPTDRPRAAERDPAGALLPLSLDAELTAALNALSRRCGVTLYMTLLAAWAVVLARVSGQDEVVIGTASANRDHLDTEGLVGFFVNTLALRVPVARAAPVRQLLEAVRDIALQAQEHQALPFEQVVELVNPTRSLRYTPLFQTMFAWQNNAQWQFAFDGLQVRALPTPQTQAKFDISLSLGERNGRIQGSIEYAAALFDADTVARWASAFEQVLRAMVLDVTQPVAMLPLVDAERAGRLLHADPVADWDLSRPLLAWCEDWVQRTPEAPALVSEAEVLSHREAHARADALAARLRAAGVGHGGLVAVCAARTPMRFVAMLAALKAGAAYLPLDPDYPSARLQAMLLDARPRAALVDAAGRAAFAAALPADWLPQDAPRPVLLALDEPERVDIAAVPSAQGSSDAPRAQADAFSPDDIAYVIYTSGSTGTPKGVRVTQRGAVNLLHAQRALFEIDPAARVLQFASCSFDACVFEWLLALANGAALHLPDAAAPTGQALEDFVAARGITHALLPPVVLAAMPAQARLQTLRVLIAGGEALPVAVAERWREGRRFFNAYGPTEDAVVSTVLDCTDPAQQLASSQAGAVPIGRALPNHRALVLDRDPLPGRVPGLLPLGAVGELYVGGVGLARDYLDQPQLTAERFLANPFHPGERLYRTGDLVRLRADGALEYHGRNDFQIKVRGFRIEPGEIESRLRAQPGVREALVIASGDSGSGQRLVAYLLGEAARVPAPEALRTALAAGLPGYMIPAAYVRLDAWPLTPNGKIDRRALPVPGDADVATRAEYLAPRTPMEEVLVEMWRELLGVQRIGVHDGFFELGGHSLMAMRLLAMLESTFGIGVSLAAFFAAPTIADLSRLLLPDAAGDAAGSEDDSADDSAVRGHDSPAADAAAPV